MKADDVRRVLERVTPEHDRECQRAALVAVRAYRREAREVYAELGMPLASDLDAANGLVGQLLQGYVRRVGPETARAALETIIRLVERGLV